MEKTFIISPEEMATLDPDLQNNLEKDQYIKITGIVKAANLVRRGLRIRIKVINVKLLGGATDGKSKKT